MTVTKPDDTNTETYIYIYIYLFIFIYIYIYPSQYILQSVRGHSAVVLTVTINGMQRYIQCYISYFKFNHNWLMFGSSQMRFL